VLTRTRTSRARSVSGVQRAPCTTQRWTTLGPQAVKSALTTVPALVDYTWFNVLVMH
jgi:hypothetical protein